MAAMTVLYTISSMALILVLAEAQYVPDVKALPAQWTRGTNFFAFSANDLADNRTLKEVAQLPFVLPGVNMVAVQFMWHQTFANSSDVHRYENTPSTEALVAFTQAAHDAGLQVYYKPIVVAQDGTEMANLNPMNISAWFEAYSSLLLDLAALAQDLGVERLAIGIELQLIATPAENLWRWETLFQQTRALYSGEVTYGSNPLTGETQLIPFWGLVDVVGVDLYIPVTYGPNASLTPSYDDMVATYRHIFDWKLGQWFANNGSQSKLMFVSESGYPSSNKGMEVPWMLPVDDACVGEYSGNHSAQAYALATQFHVLGSDPVYQTWFTGFVQFWYGQPGTSDYIGSPPGVNQGPNYQCGWTPSGKNETLDVLRAAFAQPSPPTPPQQMTKTPTPVVMNNVVTATISIVKTQTLGLAETETDSLLLE
jgi:hypothetical protein